MKKLFNKNSILSSFGLVAIIFICGTFAQTFAQDRYAIERAQQAVREKVEREKGGQVNFPAYMQNETFYISRSETGVRGYGSWGRNFNSATRDFSYEARVNNDGGRVDRIKYKFLNDSDGGGRVPSWALGTFYGKNPQTGGQIRLDIDANGLVRVDFQNAVTNGNFYDNRITIDGAVARVTRINNGIRTTRVDNGEAIDYYRDGFNNNNNNNNNFGNVPSWAVGTFYGRNPQSGGQITVNVAQNGNVTVTMDGGQPIYGTMNGDRLTIDGITSRVTRLDNGIRTTRNDNGERIDYYRDGKNTNNNTNTNRRVPSWAVGTFFGRNPQNGSTISITIQSNGDVTVSNDGAVIYGSMDGETLTINGITSRVRKIDNGIRTTRNDNGERIDYRRQ